MAFLAPMTPAWWLLFVDVATRALPQATVSASWDEQQLTVRVQPTTRGLSAARDAAWRVGADVAHAWLLAEKPVDLVVHAGALVVTAGDEIVRCVAAQGGRVAWEAGTR